MTQEEFNNLKIGDWVIEYAVHFKKDSQITKKTIFGIFVIYEGICRKHGNWLLKVRCFRKDLFNESFPITENYTLKHCELL